MLRRTTVTRVPHVTTCHALYNGYFWPTVKMPIDKPLPALGNGRSAKEAPIVEFKAGSRPKHTLVLDIDHTLVLVYEDGPSVFKSNKHPEGFEDIEQLRELAKSGPKFYFLNDSRYMRVRTRPYLQEFLEEVSELYEVVFWTAGVAGYMAAIINALERQVLNTFLCGKKSGEKPSQEEITANTSYFYDIRKNTLDLAAGNASLDLVKDASKRARPYMNYYGYFRGQTLGGSMLKHLPLLGGSVDNIIMMDDATRSFVYTPRNAILVKPFFGEADDTVLRDVMPMLRAVAKAENACRELDHWRHDDYHKLDDLDMTREKFAYLHPSSRCNDQLNLGEYLAERRACGTPIAEPRLFGEQYQKFYKPEVEAGMKKLYEAHGETVPGLLHLLKSAGS